MLYFESVFFNYQLLQLCTARTVFSISVNVTVIHCDAGGVSLIDQ